MALAVLAAGFFGMTPQFIGEIALLTVGGIVLGFAVLKLWPKTLSPQLFATLVPFAAVGGLAYLGNSAAAAALAFLAVAAVALAMIGAG